MQRYSASTRRPPASTATGGTVDTGALLATWQPERTILVGGGTGGVVAAPRPSGPLPPYSNGPVRPVAATTTSQPAFAMAPPRIPVTYSTPMITSVRTDQSLRMPLRALNKQGKRMGVASGGTNGPASSMDRLVRVDYQQYRENAPGKSQWYQQGSGYNINITLPDGRIITPTFQPAAPPTPPPAPMPIPAPTPPTMGGAPAAVPIPPTTAPAAVPAASGASSSLLSSIPVSGPTPPLVTSYQLRQLLEVATRQMPKDFQNYYSDMISTLTLVETLSSASSDPLAVASSSLSSSSSSATAMTPVIGQYTVTRMATELNEAIQLWRGLTTGAATPTVCSVAINEIKRFIDKSDIVPSPDGKSYSYKDPDTVYGFAPDKQRLAALQADTLTEYMAHVYQKFPVHGAWAFQRLRTPYASEGDDVKQSGSYRMLGFEFLDDSTFVVQSPQTYRTYSVYDTPMLSSSSAASAAPPGSLSPASASVSGYSPVTRIRTVMQSEPNYRVNVIARLDAFGQAGPVSIVTLLVMKQPNCVFAKEDVIFFVNNVLPQLTSAKISYDINQDLLFQATPPTSGITAPVTVYHLKRTAVPAASAAASSAEPAGASETSLFSRLAGYAASTISGALTQLRSYIGPAIGGTDATFIDALPQDLYLVVKLCDNSMTTMLTAPQRSLLLNMASVLELSCPEYNAMDYGRSMSSVGGGPLSSRVIGHVVTQPSAFQTIWEQVDQSPMRLRGLMAAYTVHVLKTVQSLKLQHYANTRPLLIPLNIIVQEDIFATTASPTKNGYNSMYNAIVNANNTYRETPYRFADDLVNAEGKRLELPAEFMKTLPNVVDHYLMVHLPRLRTLMTTTSEYDTFEDLVYRMYLNAEAVPGRRQVQLSAAVKADLTTVPYSKRLRDTFGQVLAFIRQRQTGGGGGGGSTLLLDFYPTLVPALDGGPVSNYVDSLIRFFTGTGATSDVGFDFCVMHYLYHAMDLRTSSSLRVIRSSVIRIDIELSTDGNQDKIVSTAVNWDTANDESKGGHTLESAQRIYPFLLYNQKDAIHARARPLGMGWMVTIVGVKNDVRRVDLFSTCSLLVHSPNNMNVVRHSLLQALGWNPVAVGSNIASGVANVMDVESSSLSTATTSSVSTSMTTQPMVDAFPNDYGLPMLEWLLQGSRTLPPNVGLNHPLVRQLYRYSWWLSAHTGLLLYSPKQVVLPASSISPAVTTVAYEYPMIHDLVPAVLKQNTDTMMSVRAAPDGIVPPIGAVVAAANNSGSPTGVIPPSADVTATATTSITAVNPLLVASNDSLTTLMYLMYGSLQTEAYINWLANTCQLMNFEGRPVTPAISVAISHGMLLSYAPWDKLKWYKEYMILVHATATLPMVSFGGGSSSSSSTSYGPPNLIATIVPHSPVIPTQQTAILMNAIATHWFGPCADIQRELSGLLAMMQTEGDALASSTGGGLSTLYHPTRTIVLMLLRQLIYPTELRTNVFQQYTLVVGIQLLRAFVNFERLKSIMGSSGVPSYLSYILGNAKLTQVLVIPDTQIAQHPNYTIVFNGIVQASHDRLVQWMMHHEVLLANPASIRVIELLSQWSCIMGPNLVSSATSPTVPSSLFVEYLWHSNWELVLLR